eukprot:m.223368 g.223368  ORF g.223368 m.223368 type:complete len:102 (-) comp15139_c0_seq7:1271-1576(-)
MDGGRGTLLGDGSDRWRVRGDSLCVGLDKDPDRSLRRVGLAEPGARTGGNLRASPTAEVDFFWEWREVGAGSLRVGRGNRTEDNESGVDEEESLRLPCVQS